LSVPKNLNLKEKIENLDQFCDAVYPRQPQLVKTVLESIRDNSLNEAQGLMRFIRDKGMDYNNFNAVIRKLKALGIIYRTGWHTYRFSSIFQIRLCKAMDFYVGYAGKPNPYQKMKEKYKILTEGVDIPVVDEREEEEEKPKEKKASLKQDEKKEIKRLAEEEKEW